MNITVGEHYDYFDDGKIRESRRHDCKILEKIPFADMFDKTILQQWKSEVEMCYWLYATETDYFLRAQLDNKGEIVYFVRTKDGRWFSLGFWGGLLKEKSFWENIKNN